ncbi:MAG: hypothetical protein KGL35_29560 [Bradyrhizobium sp.]|nr:hypothetical protein [Bradyrhizobium sp.]
MGALAHFDVGRLREDWNVRHFVETGTGRGDSLAHAAQFPFDSLKSCEVDYTLREGAQNRFRGDRRVHVSLWESRDFVSWACRTIPADQPILFWLDAHFPGADYQGQSFGAEADERVRLPLQTELDTIARLRPLSRDVVLVDDLRIYVDGPFGHGNLPPNVRPHCPAERGIGFIHETMGATHDVALLYDHEGYVVMTPKREG